MTSTIALTESSGHEERKIAYVRDGGWILKSLC